MDDVTVPVDLAARVKASAPPASRPGEPRGLASSLSFWRSAVKDYDLRLDERRVLEDACREMDLIDRLQSAIDSPDFELTTKGSMGQVVSDPLIQEIRQHRTVVARLLAGLKLPEESAGAKPAAGRSTSARQAANASWGKR